MAPSQKYSTSSSPWTGSPETAGSTSVSAGSATAGSPDSVPSGTSEPISPALSGFSSDTSPVCPASSVFPVTSGFSGTVFSSPVPSTPPFSAGASSASSGAVPRLFSPVTGSADSPVSADVSTESASSASTDGLVPVIIRHIATSTARKGFVFFHILFMSSLLSSFCKYRQHISGISILFS